MTIQLKSRAINLAKGMDKVLPDVFSWLTEPAKPSPETRKYPYETSLDAIGSSWAVVAEALMREARNGWK